VTRSGEAVSVVVAAHNEADHIGRLIRTLSEQTVVPDEIVVVDDGSRDATASIATSLGATVVRTTQKGPAMARNLGVRRAAGDIIVFLDGDMSVDARFIEDLTLPIRTQGVSGTFTREIYLGNPENSWAVAYGRIRRLGSRRLLPDSFPDHWENFRAVRRDCFLACGGYDNVGYGEDMTLAPKLGELAVAAVGAKCFHFSPSSLHEIAENGRWIGRGHDIRLVPHPWRDNSWRAIRRCVVDVRRGGTWHSIPARIAYHGGVVVGLCDRKLRPGRHWK